MTDGVAFMIGDCRRARIRVRHVLLVRGFCTVAVMAALDRVGVWFIMQGSLNGIAQEMDVGIEARPA